MNNTKLKEKVKGIIRNVCDGTLAFEDEYSPPSHWNFVESECRKAPNIILNEINDAIDEYADHLEQQNKAMGKLLLSIEIYWEANNDSNSLRRKINQILKDNGS